MYKILFKNDEDFFERIRDKFGKKSEYKYIFDYRIPYMPFH